MKARLRIFVVASAALMAAGTSALAQETPAPARTDVIGPPQLQDFSLNGTVTRPSTDPVPVQQAPRQATARPANEQGSQSESSRPPQPPRSAQADPPRERPAATASSSASADLPPPTPARRTTPLPVSASSDAAVMSPEPAFVPAASESELNRSQNALPMLPWLIAALALLGAAAWYFLRQRPRESYAGAGALAFEAPSPAPAPQPVRTPPPAAPPKRASDGIVSTRLRPWLEIEFIPQRVIVDDQRASIAFELSVFNSGSAPARDVLLEASLFNAGPNQDEQIRMFFDNPDGRGNRIPAIPPLQRISVNTAVFLARDQVRPIEVEGRQLFVPMIAFNALYGWGGGEGQTSASYLVGKTTKTDKLAPFRLDLGPRVSRSLDAREHELRLRK